MSFIRKNMPLEDLRKNMRFIPINREKVRITENITMSFALGIMIMDYEENYFKFVNHLTTVYNSKYDYMPSEI